MARNGSGSYSLPAGNPIASGVTSNSTTMNTTLADLGDEITNSLAKDGQTTPTDNLKMGGYKHTTVADTTARTDYAKASQTQDSAFIYLTSVSGTNTITATGPLAMSAYVTGQKFHLIAVGANTDAVTININGIAPKNMTKFGATALAANNILANMALDLIYDGTQFQLLNPSAIDLVARQVVTATSSTNDLTSSTSYVDTSLTATITPRYADSKILIQVNAPYDVRGDGTNTGQRYGEAQIYRSSGTPASLHEVRIGRAVESAGITAPMQMYLPASFQAEEEPGAGTHVYIVRHKVVATNVDMTLAGASTQPSTHNSGPASITLWEVEP